MGWLALDRPPVRFAIMPLVCPLPQKLRRKLQSSEILAALAAWLSEPCDNEKPDGEETQQGDGARGSRSTHAKDDETTMVVAAARHSKLGLPPPLASRDTRWPGDYV